MQFQHRISQRIGDTEACQRRSDGPDEHMLGNASCNDEAADANIVAGLNSHTRREVNGLRWRRTWGNCRRSGRCDCGVAVGVTVGVAVIPGVTVGVAVGVAPGVALGVGLGVAFGSEGSGQT